MKAGDRSTGGGSGRGKRAQPAGSAVATGIEREGDEPWSRRVRRWALVLVFALGFGHAALYGVTFPPWAVEDEQQHVDYVWKVAFDHRLASIDDEIAYGIVESVFGTDRFGAYDMARPEPDATSMGLQARSYAAYHPPAAYVVLAPVVAAAGERALLVLYLLRAVTAVAAGAVAVATALLAVDVAALARRRVGAASARAAGHRSGSTPTDPQPGGATASAPPRSSVGPSADGGLGGAPPRATATAIALAAGVAIAALPALADSGGRVNTDIFAALIVVVGCRAVLRWVDRPTAGRSWALGIVLAVAVVTRETALVLAVPVIVAVAHLVRGQRLDRGSALRALAPPVAATVAWVGFQWQRSGFFDGSRSFLATYGDLLTLPDPRPVAETVGDALVVPYGSWGVPWLLVVALVGVALVGLVLLARAGEWVVAATATGMLVFVVVAMVAAMQRDLNVPTARLLLPAYPAVIAAATVGWSTGRARWAPFALTIPVVAFGAWFAATELLVRFSPGIG